jgi:hypothetical protein
VLLPDATDRGSHLHDAMSTAVEATSLPSCRCEATELAVLHDRPADPIGAGVVADDGVHRVDENDLEILVCRVLIHPVRVQDAEVAALAPDAFLGDGALVARKLELRDTLVLRLSILNSLGNWALSATAADPDAVDDVALLGLVS